MEAVRLLRPPRRCRRSPPSRPPTASPSSRRPARHAAGSAASSGAASRHSSSTPKCGATSRTARSSAVVPFDHAAYAIFSAEALATTRASSLEPANSSATGAAPSPREIQRRPGLVRRAADDASVHEPRVQRGDLGCACAARSRSRRRRRRRILDAARATSSAACGGQIERINSASPGERVDRAGVAERRRRAHGSPRSGPPTPRARRARSPAARVPTAAPISPGWSSPTITARRRARRRRTRARSRRSS